MAYQPIRGAGSGLQFLNYPFGDTTYTKVFVGELAWETKSETLHSYVEQFGEILEAVVITDKHTGRSKGYGFQIYCYVATWVIDRSLRKKYTKYRKDVLNLQAIDEEEDKVVNEPPSLVYKVGNFSSKVTVSPFDEKLKSKEPKNSGGNVTLSERKGANYDTIEDDQKRKTENSLSISRGKEGRI